jgi:chromosome partitioning protein
VPIVGVIPERVPRVPAMNPLVEFLQQNASVFAILAAVATVLGVAFTIYKTSHDRLVKDLREQIRQKDRRIETLEREGPEGLRLLNRQLGEQLEQASKDAREAEANHAAAEAAWRSEETTLRQQGTRLGETVDSLTGELEAAKEELARRDRADQARANLMKRAMKLEGRVWERKVLQGVPRFRPLHDRHAAVISVLNLKGGVGKTTITAHLGATLSARGYRVLLLDLDLQGSLSSLFINPTILAQRSEKRLLLQHFLTSLAERRKANLLEYCVPIFEGRGAIVPSADSMAYGELNLTMQWLLRLGKRDTRFLLRKALHQRRVTNRYDIVLLDCPPLFNTCCVNALAASDYILIPVLPSRKAAERVPLLLDRLQGLHRVINPELQVMGTLLNRTRGVQLTAWEQDLWRDMLERGQDRWKLPVHAFETFIRQTTEVRDSETEFSPPAPGSELHTLFSRLAAELEERLPRDCRRTAAAPIGPG